MEKNKNISWINYVRVICLFFVYFYHAENRANFDFLGRNFDVFYKPFFVNAFFIVSGYVLFKKQEQIYQRVKTIHIWFNEFGKDDYLLTLDLYMAIIDNKRKGKKEWNGFERNIIDYFETE